jgi:RimJ/RimL family protein N-acetyltransferase
MKVDCGVCELRPFRPDDAPSIAELANDRDIWINLRDRFPHPYELSHAKAYIVRVSKQNPPTSLAISFAGRAVGSISVILGSDIERVNAEIGYWLGKPYWGRGILSAALGAMTQYAIKEFKLTRVFAVPFVRNPASSRVLEKTGFIREGLMKQSAIKDGVVEDQYLYAFYA